MIERAKDDLDREIAAMRESYLNGRSLASVADAMQSALDEALKAEPDQAAVNALVANPVGPMLVANPAVVDASVDPALRPQVEGHPEQTAPGTALTDAHIEAAAEAGAVNVDPSKPEAAQAPASDVASSGSPDTSIDPAPAEPVAELAPDGTASGTDESGNAASNPAPDSRSDEDRRQDERLDRIEQEQRDERK
jgi:hypothetical protein